MELTKQDISYLRVAKSGLITPFKSITECVGSLFGIQAQAQQFAEINILNRVSDISDMYSLFTGNQIIKIWGQRMTVHLYTAGDWKNVHQIFAHRNNFVKKGWAGNETIFNKIMQEFDTITHHGQVSKETLAEIIEQTAPHIKNEYLDYSLILQASLNGIIYGIPQMPHTRYYAHRVTTGIGEEEFVNGDKNRHQTIKDSLQRYFRYFGPATLADYCHWSGLTKSEVSLSFKDLEKELTVYTAEGKSYYLPKEDPDKHLIQNQSPDIPVRLLGKFDPLFLSFADKSWIADSEQQKAIWRPGGHVEAVLLINGEAAGTWRYTLKGNQIDFTFHTFRKITTREENQITPEALKLASYLSKPLNSLHFE